MSRTFKDRPYRIPAREALDHGFVRDSRPPRPVTGDVWSADMAGYFHSRRNRRNHLPLRRWGDWRWIEGDWVTDYGSRHEIRARLRLAAEAYNHGLMTDDWDDPVVYQRRRCWHL
ncbi:hypothetical protein CS006_03385 [Bifidobacterium primatium]|uniref:Uncharacterized protein n=2 Tax=Bifidobacterium primatium TaxID=2045438 RepID=A0A2M9HBI7_9BIFI|nr:hypothetical protein CS006_03385 [Bifidobacterium primatium]